MNRLWLWLKKIASLVAEYPIIVFGVYVLAFMLALFQLHSGAGQYWDWTFPVYKDQISAYFQHASMSWNNSQMGGPLGYSSDYYFRFLVSLLRFMQPETVLYIVLVSLSAAGAYGVYLITKRSAHVGLAFLLGLAAYINPAIFYKLTAGHIDYYVSYTIFIYFIYFLFYKYKRSVYRVVLLALLLGLVGVQIQFFVISLLFLICYFLFHRDAWSWRYSPLLVVIPLGINWVWLSNFLFGGKSIVETSLAASKVSFSRASSTQFSSIFSFKFSDATLISHFFSWQALLCYTTLFALLIFFLIKHRRKDSTVLSLLCFLLVVVFMATGLFEAFNLGPLNNIFPMFREVGHFAPLIALVLLLALGRYLKLNTAGYIASFLIIGGIVMTTTQYQTHLQTINFASLRQQLAEFKSNDDRADHDGQSRILSYPFFQPFALKSNGLPSGATLPLANSGYDNLAAFSRQDYIGNDMSPEKISSSPQYQLLTHNYDITVLQPYHVRFIYDMSSVYASTYHFYASPDTYPKQLQGLDNDPEFLNKVIAANPGKVTRVSSHILEINDSSPIVHVIDAPVVDSQQANQTNRASFLSSTLGNRAAYVPHDIINGAGSVRDLFGGSQNQSINQDIADSFNVEAGSNSILYKNIGIQTLGYSSDKTDVRITQRSIPNPKIDGVVTGQNTQASVTISMLPYATHPSPLLIVNDSRVIPLTPATQRDIGKTNDIESAGIYETGLNIVPQASFEKGLWQQSVSDCNNYDANPQIAMDWNLDHASGQHSLELRAKRHTACTFSTFPTRGLDGTYILSIKYKTADTAAAGYYLSFDDPERTVIQQFNLDATDSWQSLYRAVRIPKNATKATLYLYGFPGDGHDYSSVHYDDVVFAQAKLVTELTLNHNDTYAPFGRPLNPGSHTFTYASNDLSQTNMIKNGSFEDGPWKPKVLDCNNYDANPQIEQRINTSDHTDGHQSLELSATHHNACTNTSFGIGYLGKYHLTFDYKTLSDKSVLYYMQFDDPNHTVVSDDLAANNGSWNHFDKLLEVPAGATSATLWLYAIAPDDDSTNIVRFDNVRFTAAAETQGIFSVLAKPTVAMQAPKKIIATPINSTEYAVRVKSAEKQFILGLAENFHPGWNIYLMPIASQSCNKEEERATGDQIVVVCKDEQAFIRPSDVTFAMEKSPLPSTDMQLNHLTNGWLIDPTYIKNHYGSDYYRLNSDGSLDINLMIYFKPQSYFYLGLLVSITTLAGTFAALYWLHRKKTTTESDSFKIRTNQ